MTEHNPPGPDNFRPALPFSEPVQAELVMSASSDDTIRSPSDLADMVPGSPRFPVRPRRRRVLLPIVLFLASCASTFWVGTTFLVSREIESDAIRTGLATAAERAQADPELAKDPAALASIREQASLLYVIQHNYPSGLTYMSAVIGILLCHEMGHFLQALRHRVPASLPFFIPMPIGPIGTMGAVIGMNGLQADRRELFDIGITGPIAGLVVAIPITWFGIMQAEVAPPVDPLASGGMIMHDPWLVKQMIAYLRPEVPPGRELLLNPLLLAGWVGMLVTGLNMMPVSQLDGGHVIYSLFGRRIAHAIAKIFVMVAVLYIIFAEASMWMVMLVLVIVMGATHPPTADDSVELTLPQKIVGYASLAIPFLCFPPQGITVN
jgi:membrane-associated protease RseP (regulator of RpoE activity)